MIVHSLTKSALFVTVGHVSHVAGSQSIDRIRGLIHTQPVIGWCFLIATVALAGFPPFGIFTSEFLLFTATMKSYPWLVIPLLSGLAVAFAGLFRHMQRMVYGDAPEGQVAVQANMWPVILHLLLVLWLGIHIPGVLVDWLDQATIMVVGKGVL
jgi:hydrogenase-4 component F